MELHRKSRQGRRIGYFMLAFGLAGIGVPSLAEWSGVYVPSMRTPFWYYLFGGLLALAGLVTIYQNARPFRLVVDEHGLTVRAAGLDRLVPWDAVEAVSIETLVVKGVAPQHGLVLWPVKGAQLGAKPSYRKQGCRGFHLIDLDQLAEPPADVLEVFARYAGQKFEPQGLHVWPGRTNV